MTGAILLMDGLAPTILGIQDGMSLGIPIGILLGTMAGIALGVMDGEDLCTTVIGTVPIMAGGVTAGVTTGVGATTMTGDGPETMYITMLIGASTVLLLIVIALVDSAVDVAQDWHPIATLAVV